MAKSEAVSDQCSKELASKGRAAFHQLLEQGGSFAERVKNELEFIRRGYGYTISSIRDENGVLTINLQIKLPKIKQNLLQYIINNDSIETIYWGDVNRYFDTRVQLEKINSYTPEQLDKYIRKVRDTIVISLLRAYGPRTGVEVAMHANQRVGDESKLVIYTEHGPKKNLADVPGRFFLNNVAGIKVDTRKYDPRISLPVSFSLYDFFLVSDKGENKELYIVKRNDGSKWKPVPDDKNPRLYDCVPWNWPTGSNSEMEF